MANTARTSTIRRQDRGTRCLRTLKVPAPTAAIAAGATPPRPPRWFANVDAAASQKERAMLLWLDLAARYHTDPPRDIIVALKTVEAPSADSGDRPALYVWEVAWQRGQDGIKWQFIVWDVSGHGVRFHDCADRAEAMDLYSLPIEQGIAAVRHSPGVYLRPECRPT